jgi:transposase
MTSQNKTRKTYSAEFKEEALKLAAKVGVAKAARELSLCDSQLYAWRSAAQKKASTSERETTLATENAKLKRQLVEQAQGNRVLLAKNKLCPKFICPACHL